MEAVKQKKKKKRKESENIRKKERTMEKGKVWANSISFPSLLKFCKLSLTIKAKMITNVVINICKGNS